MGLPAIYNKDSTILILGSYPSQESINKGEYYSKKGNRFWKLFDKWFGTNLENADYTTKKKEVLAKKVALSDVCSICNRNGSSDSNITNAIFNDELVKILNSAKIGIIYVAGEKAKKLLRKFFKKEESGFAKLIKSKYIKIYAVPSTSGANTHYKTIEDLLTEWNKMKSRIYCKKLKNSCRLAKSIQ